MRRTGSLSYVFEEKPRNYKAAHGEAVAMPRTRPERLGAFSDGVFAVIITIMVLDLRPPSEATLAALLRLWPAALSYVVSYLFIAIVWVNHHHLLRFAEHATPRLIWVNFAHLFMVSLVPFSTAGSRILDWRRCRCSCMQRYFVLVNLAYCAFVWEALAQAEVEEVSARMRRITRTRSFPDVGNVRDCDVTVTQVSFVGLWVGLLCFACLSSAGSP